MLYATELMGAKTYDAQGNYVGKIREFFIEPADQPNRISHYLLVCDDDRCAGLNLIGELLRKFGVEPNSRSNLFGLDEGAGW